MLRDVPTISGDQAQRIDYKEEKKLDDEPLTHSRALRANLQERASAARKVRACPTNAIAAVLVPTYRTSPRSGFEATPISDLCREAGRVDHSITAQDVGRAAAERTETTTSAAPISGSLVGHHVHVSLINPLAFEEKFQVIGRK